MDVLVVLVLRIIGALVDLSPTTSLWVTLQKGLLRVIHQLRAFADAELLASHEDIQFTRLLWAEQAGWRIAEEPLKRLLARGRVSEAEIVVRGWVAVYFVHENLNDCRLAINTWRQVSLELLQASPPCGEDASLAARLRRQATRHVRICRDALVASMLLDRCASFNEAQKAVMRERLARLRQRRSISPFWVASEEHAYAALLLTREYRQNQANAERECERMCRQ